LLGGSALDALPPLSCPDGELELIALCPDVAKLAKISRAEKSGVDEDDIGTWIADLGLLKAPVSLLICEACC
jgi:hypothetical protein